MSFNWINFLKLAENLIKNKDEASLRSAISRAYYSIFCIARNKAGFKNHREADIHGKVIRHYQNSGNPREKQIGQILSNLRRNRNIADYNEDKIIDHKLAQIVILKAKEALKKLKIS